MEGQQQEGYFRAVLGAEWTRIVQGSHRALLHSMGDRRVLLYFADRMADMLDSAARLRHVFVDEEYEQLTVLAGSLQRELQDAASSAQDSTVTTLLVFQFSPQHAH